MISSILYQKLSDLVRDAYNDGVYRFINYIVYHRHNSEMIPVICSGEVYIRDKDWLYIVGTYDKYINTGNTIRVNTKINKSDKFRVILEFDIIQLKNMQDFVKFLRGKEQLELDDNWVLKYNRSLDKVLSDNERDRIINQYKVSTIEDKEF